MVMGQKKRGKILYLLFLVVFCFYLQGEQDFLMENQEIKFFCKLEDINTRLFFVMQHVSSLRPPDLW